MQETERSPAAPAAAGEPKEDPHGTGLLIWVLWLTYGSFYFCRSNISAAVPGLGSELGLSKTEISWILGSLKITYGLGQFVNGQLAERFSPRRLLAIGMFASAALNVIFGWSAGLYFLLFVWATNGYAQSLGWTPTMRVAANWLPAARRGRSIGLIGTGYMVTAALTYVIAGTSVELFGWRGAFFVPAVLLSLSGVHMLFLLREAPSDATAAAPAAPRAQRHTGPIWQNIKITLQNPALWFLAVALGLLNANRYGFLDWGLTHIKEVQNTGVGSAAIKYMVLPLGGIAGSYGAGWASDRLFGGRRAPVMFILLVVLGLLTLLYNRVVHLGAAPTVITLFFVGFVIYGPQVLLVGTAPVDLARRGTAAAAVGFVNAMGYLGASVGDIATGWMAQHFGWKAAVQVWAAWAFVAALVVALLWNATARKGREAT